MDDTSFSSPSSSGAAPVHHGGDLAAAAARFGTPGNSWLDLSTGINPVAYPLGPVPETVMARLPDGGDLEGLHDAARRAYGASPEAAMVAAPGTQALIQALPRLFPVASVGIMGPTYGEHAPAWAVAGHRVADERNICGLAAGPWSYAVVVNPNNPDGRVQQPDGVLAFAEELHGRGGVLVIDEAFVDVSPELSVSAYAGTQEHKGLVVLRSFGKFFGLAGVRLGFAIGERETMARLESALGPWAVSGPAIWAGARALADTTWASETRARLKNDAARMDSLLTGFGMEIVGGTDLFRLASHDDAQGVYERLGSAGVLVRRFDDHPSWLRFGLCANEGDWSRLEKTLGKTT